ncbi:MAG: NADPH-dependent F420 reductase [Dehalococcoidia bacterium]
MKIGFIGGTGEEGRGLALRLALAGHHAIIGSRDEERGQQVAHDLAETCEDPGAAKRITGGSNEDTAREGEVVFLAVPYSAMASTLRSVSSHLRGKVCVNVIAPLEFVSGRARGIIPPAGSAAEEAEREVPDARWVAGFHTVPARGLLRQSSHMDTDALICSDDQAASKLVMDLAGEISGLRGVNAGPLECARYLEGATALLININRIYKAHGSVKIAGI